ncbi:ion transporter [Flavobacteriaceae bacterium]|nr:ion transporter [Flavobacteriaceae bacterium]
MKVKNYLRKIVEDNTTKKGRFFDYIIQLLIFLSLISFSVETLPNIPEKASVALRYFEVFSVLIFSIEYLLRLWVSKKPLSYIFSFYGIIDILAILPFYMVTFLDLRFLRAFRILRIFRALKVIRYNKAIERFGAAFKLVKEEFVLFFACALILIFISSAGIFYFEHEAQPETFKSIFHSAWWAIVTLTSVGYGDVYPITLGGRIFTFFVLMIGLGIVTVPAGLVASALSKAREIED